MELQEAITRAVLKAGTQKELAKQLGIQPQALSDIKNGRKYCGPKIHAKLVAIAEGQQDAAQRTILEGFIAQLRDEVEHEAAVKKSLQAILDALPAHS